MSDDVKLQHEKADEAAAFDRAPPEEDTFRPAPPHEGIFREIWDFFRVRKKFWLAPIIIALMLLGALLWLAGSAGIVSPFLYAL